MIWAVLDTNTIVSGMGWSGPPSAVVDHALRGRFVMVTSRPLLDELARVLQGPKLAPVFDDPLSLVVLIQAASVLVEPSVELGVVADDPADNRVLEAAQAAGADYIVTGDSDLLDLQSFEARRFSGPSSSWRFSSCADSPSVQTRCKRTERDLMAPGGTRKQEGRRSPHLNDIVGHGTTPAVTRPHELQNR